MNEWGIPDWRNVSEYGKTSAWDLHRWRWEFYRRRSDIREDFDNYKDEHYRNCCEVSLAHDGSSEGVFKPTDKRFKVAALGCHEKYGYGNLPNPRYGDHGLSHIFPDGDREDDMSVILPGFDGKTSREVGVGPKSYGYVFDLEKPLAPQMESAREGLERAQLRMTGGNKARKRRHITKYLMYLRVLDARAAGCSWSEISKILIHTVADAQTARDVHKQAEALCFNSWS